MTLSRAFVVAAGSVTGREHRRAERDGQDGHAVVVTDEILAVVVTDGCSSGRKSEIGARIGAAWIATLVEQRFHGDDCLAAVAEVTRELLVRLEVLARSLDAAGEVTAARVDEALLFTFLAAVVTPHTTIVFGIGDGVVLVDEVVTVLDPGPDNAPPYVAYALLGARIETRVHFAANTSDVDLVAIATDGITDIADLAADPRYERNPSLLRKRLVVLSDRGAFSDDATLGVVRRRSAS
ncbi:MAG: hypothetical protein JWP87_3471 [Labilithrix sp.]|nr:hypothetical protein [Labilithrix sp.]